MSMILCLGCKENCELDTTNDEIFRDNGLGYDCKCYCPYSSCFVSVDESELQQLWNEDNGVEMD